MTAYTSIRNPRVLSRLVRIGPLSRRLADAIAACDATPEEAAQARRELPAAIAAMSHNPQPELPLERTE